MGVVYLLVALLIPVAIIAAVIFVARQLFRRDGGGAADGQGVRRFFQYLLLYGLLVVAAIGVSGVLGRLLQGPGLVDEAGPGLARAISFSVIGLPLFLLVAAWSRRQLSADPEEAASLGWNAYATIAPLTCLVVAMVSLYAVLVWLFGSDDYDGGALARLIVWGALWLVHWVVGRRLGTGRRSDPHLALGSLIGLGTAGSGLVWLLAAAVTALWRNDGLVIGTRHNLAQAAAVTIVGALAWSVYWLRTFSRMGPSPVWLGYVLPVGVGGGLVAAIGAGATALYQVLVWFVGEPVAPVASRHFASLPRLGAAVVVGGLAWWYHREVLETVEGRDRTEARRVYEYLIAGGGLLAAAAGLTTIIVAAVEALTGSAAVEIGTSAINTLLAAVTLLMVGAPLWWSFWQRIQRAEATAGEEEVVSPTRRIYLFLLFGVGGVVAVIALLVGVFIAVEDVLEARFNSETVRSMRFALGLLVTTGGIAAYHWAVFRDDRRLHPEEPQAGPRRVVLIGPADRELARRLAHDLGARVETWARTDVGAVAWDFDELLSLLRATAHHDVVVVARPDGPEVIGIDRDA